MSKHFSNKVQAILERRSRPSIRILMEEEGDKEEEGGLFDMPDEPDEEEGEKEEAPEPSSEEDSDESSSDENVEEEPESDKETQLADIANQAKKSKEGIESVKIKIDDLSADNGEIGVAKVQNHISRFLESNVSLTPSNIKNYLFEFVKSDLEYIEKNLDDVQNTIDKADSFVKGYGTGKDVPISKYVEGAINAFEHFDNLFSKEEFIIQAVVNLLILNTGSQAKNHIEDFKDEFAKALSKKNINFDDKVLKNISFKNAAGAKSTG